MALPQVNTLFDWPFFVLLFGAGIVSMCAKLFQDAVDSRWRDQPYWTVIHPNAQLIVSLINVPLYWSPTVILIYGFFILPWYTVVICAVADQIVGAALLAFFLRRLGSVSVALLVSYVIAAITTLWYFEFVREMHAHVLDLGSYLGIGFCVFSIIRGLFLGGYRSWREFKRSRY